MSSFMKGTAILTIGMFLSKVLGLIYVFPFYAIIGEENVALYSYGFIPYSIMLSIAISGAPVAVSKFVSKYNSQGDYAAGRKLMKSGVFIMIGSGVVCFAALYLLADPIAGMVIKDDEQIFTTNQIAGVIRWVSFALLVVPFMSITRGFFQGYGHMTPTAVSQLIEQIVRIIVVLVGAFIMMRLFNGTPESAISFALFASFIGALGGLLVMGYYWKKTKPEFDLKLRESVDSGDFSYVKIYKEVLTYSIPYVFVGIASTLFQLIDMLTFNTAMAEIGLAKVSDLYLSMLNFTTQKIVMIPVMLATGFSMALVPAITRFYTQRKHSDVIETMDKTFQILLFVTLPAVIGISVLSYEIYAFLYSPSDMGAHILALYAPVAILFALFSVTAALLQGIDHQKWIIFSLLVGILIKLSINIPMIEAFEASGAIYATTIGYIFTIGINIAVIVKVLNYKPKRLMRRILLIAILTAVMVAVVMVVRALLGFILPEPNTRWIAMVYLFICGGVGVVVYGFLSLKLGLAQKLLGSRFERLVKKLHIH